MATEKLPPLERYIRMLELLTAFPDGLALSELSAMIELPKASAHRLIKTLQELELAATSSPGSATYVTGP
ncbi:helix-turn-helix domain-containing protein, partial [Bordetella pertussis]